MENDEMKNGKAENKGGRGAAKCPRPVWVDDRDAAELPNFEPSPALYNCACAFLWDEAQRAFADGDNTLLSRAGVADAIEFITNPCNAGTGAAAYAEMLEDWRHSMKAEAAQAEARKTAKMINADLPRIDFWRKFEPDADRDVDAMEFRRSFLIRRRGGLLRLMQKMKEQGEIDFYNGMTDAFIFPAIDTANPEPEHVRAYWLNSRFSMAGEELARWLSVAALPNYEKQLAELRGRIAENFGVFPAPFECVEDDSGDLCAPRNVIALCAKIHEKTGNAKKAKEARDALKKIPVRWFVRLDGDELQTLLYIARAQARQVANGGGRSKQGAANPSGNAGEVVINTPVVKLKAGKVETSAQKEKPAGRANGISQADFAALLKHYGGRFDGEPYKVRAIKEWDANPKRRPMAGGVVYSPELRNDPIAARKWAMDFNAESQRRWNARKSGLRFY